MPTCKPKPSAAEMPWRTAQLLGGTTPAHGEPQVALWIIATPHATSASAHATMTRSNCCQRFSRMYGRQSAVCSLQSAVLSLQSLLTRYRGDGSAEHT